MIHRGFSLGVQVKCNPSWLCTAVGTFVSSATVPVILPWLSGGIASLMGTPGYVASALELLQCLCVVQARAQAAPGNPSLGQKLGSRELRTEEPTELCNTLPTPCQHPAMAASSYFWNELELLWL